MLLAFVGFVIWLSMGAKNQEIRTEIEISASPEKVWSILTDFNHWNTWNTTITKTSGNAAIGSTLKISMRGSDGKDSNAYMPVISELEAPKLLRWKAKMMADFIFHNEKIVELETTETGTRIIHRELFEGLMVRLFWDQMESGVPPILNTMNSNLKTIAEKD